MAPKQNLKKQISARQFHTTTIIPQYNLQAIINRSNSSFQAKSSCSTNFNSNLNIFSINKEPGIEASLVDDKLAQVLVLYAR